MAFVYFRTRASARSSSAPQAVELISRHLKRGTTSRIRARSITARPSSRPVQAPDHELRHARDQVLAPISIRYYPCKPIDLRQTTIPAAFYHLAITAKNSYSEG